MAERLLGLLVMLDFILFLFFPFFMALAAMIDMVTMTISNKISIVLIAGFCILAYLIGMDLKTFGWNWVMFAVVLSVGFTLFAFNIIGGGDAKFAASTSLWFGWENTLEFIVYASLIGGVITLVLLKVRTMPLPSRVERVEWATRLWRADTGVPYGIALGLAALLVYPNTHWMLMIK